MFATRGSDKPFYPSSYQPSFFADKQPLSQENDEDIEGGVLVSRKTLSDLPIFTRDDPHNLSFQTRLFRRFRIGSIYPTRHSGNSHDQPFQYSGFIAAIFLAKKYGSDIDDKVSRVRVLTQPGNRVLAAMLNMEKGRRPLRRKTGELQKAVGLHCFYNFQFVWDARRNAVNQITLYSTMALFERFE